MDWYLGSDIDGFRWFIIATDDDLTGWSAVWSNSDGSTRSEPLEHRPSPKYLDQWSSEIPWRWVAPCDHREPLPSFLQSPDGTKFPITEAEGVAEAGQAGAK